MRVERQEPEFRPVTITLETQGEANIMFAVMANVIQGDLENRMTYQLYTELYSWCNYPEGLVVEGDIKFVKEF